MVEMGYIFNRYEIAYIAKLMGATFLFNIDMNINESSENIVRKAEESLISKNYVFKDFNDNYILSGELAEHFYPFVFPEKIISCMIKRSSYERNVVIYIKNRRYTVVEQDMLNKNNYIFSLNNRVNDLLEDIIQLVVDEKTESVEDKKSRFIINTSEYEVFKDMVLKEDEEGFNYFMSKLKIDKSLSDDIKKLFSDDKDLISMCFFPDYKNNPSEMYCLIYYFVELGCWKLNTEASYKNNMTFSSITAETIINDILSSLSKITGVNYEKNNNLFK